MEDTSSVHDHDAEPLGLGETDEPYLPSELGLEHEKHELSLCDETFDIVAALVKTDDYPMMAGRPRVIKKFKGGVQVYDYRRTGILPANGGRIQPLIMVEHIPVIRQMTGLQDFAILARVLRGQGLSLQAATDGSGNVALYNDLNELCYQARGANSVSCGVEHMHATTGEAWSKHQLRASAWLWQYAEREYGIPMRVAKISGGGGRISVNKRGHTSHERVSAAAGYNDRSDPGPGYDWEYIRKAALFFKSKGHFEGV